MNNAAEQDHTLAVTELQLQPFAMLNYLDGLYIFKQFICISMISHGFLVFA